MNGNIYQDGQNIGPLIYLQQDLGGISRGLVFNAETQLWDYVNNNINET